MQDKATRVEFFGDEEKELLEILEVFEVFAAANSFHEMEHAFAVADAAFSDHRKSREAKS